MHPVAVWPGNAAPETRPSARNPFVSRPVGIQAFSAAGEQLPPRFAHYLAHALTQERNDKLVGGDNADNSGEGILFLNPAGGIRHGCPVGPRLFHDATRADGITQQPAATRSTPPARLAVRVRRRGSMASRLWQETRRFKLSARERQVAVLLALGPSYEDVAGHLGVGRDTAVSYVRRAYEKLGISQREQLVSTLLSTPS